MADDKWVQGTIEHPGSLRAAAKKAGALGKDGKIKRSWLTAQAKKGGIIGRRARLALTLGKMRHKKATKK